MFENLYYIENNNINVIDIIGFNGPIILFLVSVINLWKQKYIYGYLLFYIINTFINNLLKNTIKQARPNNTMNTITEKYPGVHKYGMPSYHAQSVFFSLTFLYLVKRSVFLLLIESFIAFMTIYQRWVNRHHTIEQLIVGSFIGICNAYISYLITNQYFVTNRSI
jgi:membrane-associated phospholipid phosphatase